MDISELADKLLEHPQFVLLLKQTVSGLVEETQLERRQAAEIPEVNSLIHELYELVRQAVDLTVKAETNGFTDTLLTSFNRMKSQIEKQILQFHEDCKAELTEIATDCRRALKTIKNEIMEDRLRMEKKNTAMKQTIDSLANKVKSVQEIKVAVVETTTESICPIIERSINENTVLSDEKVDEITKKVASLEDSLSTTENNIQDRYQATIRGLWNVVTDLSGRMATCESKFTDQPKPKKEARPVRKSMWAFM